MLEAAPTLADALSPESRQRFEKVQQGLTTLGIPFRLNPRLVRGLDYYSHTAFEITSDRLGAQATVCGGGRYDGLIAQLGGAATPAIGWALGMGGCFWCLKRRRRLIPKAPQPVWWPGPRRMPSSSTVAFRPWLQLCL